MLWLGGVRVLEAFAADACAPSAVCGIAQNTLVHRPTEPAEGCCLLQGRKQAGRLELLSSYQQAFRAVLQLLGLWTGEPEAVLAELRQLALVRAGLTEEVVAAAIEERTQARQAKDYAAADAVRLRMEALGVLFMDMPAGTMWKPGPRLHIAEVENAAVAAAAADAPAVV